MVTLPNSVKITAAASQSIGIFIPQAFVEDYLRFVSIVNCGDLPSVEAARQVVVELHRQTLSGWCPHLPIDHTSPSLEEVQISAILTTFATAEAYRFASRLLKTPADRQSAMDIAHNALIKFLPRLFCSRTKFANMQDYDCFQKYCYKTVQNASKDEAQKCKNEPKPVEATDFMTAARALYLPHKRYIRKTSEDL